MGCELTKLVNRPRSSDEVKDKVVTVIENPAAVPAVDPRLPLTARQKYSMLASWKGISRALEPTGVYMFVK
jgi:hypothetical protein